MGVGKNICADEELMSATRGPSNIQCSQGYYGGYDLNNRVCPVIVLVLFNINDITID